MQKHDIVFIGSGNVAWHLASQFHKVGHRILQIYSRNLSHADLLAENVDATAINDLAQLNLKASIYIMAVNDDAIETIANAIDFTDKLLVHTSATVAMDILKKATKHIGVFYPLQTLTKEHDTDFSVVPICIEAGDQRSKNQLMNLATGISNKVQYVTSNERKVLHVAAVLVNNFTNHLFQIGEEILDNYNLDFELVKPLILETVNKIESKKPSECQTGPASRGDWKTINAHLQILNSHPEFEEIYKVLSNSISKK